MLCTIAHLEAGDDRPLPTARTSGSTPPNYRTTAQGAYPKPAEHTSCSSEAGRTRTYCSSWSVRQHVRLAHETISFGRASGLFDQRKAWFSGSLLLDLRAFAPDTEPMPTHKKNTRKTNNVNKIQGRPRRSDSEVNLSAVGTRIRKLRGQITQEEFARGLGISQAQLSKYELGQSAVSLGVLIKLAKKSGGTADWILTGEGEASESD